MCGTTANPHISCLVPQSECVCPAVYGVGNYHHVHLYDQVNIFVNIVISVLQYHLIQTFVNVSQPVNNIYILVYLCLTWRPYSSHPS